MSRSSRRSFLKVASSTAAAIAITNRYPAWAGQQGSPGLVRVWSTFRDRRHAAGEAIAWKPVSDVAPDAIVLDPASTKQEILGFGGALTDATCCV